MYTRVTIVTEEGEVTLPTNVKKKELIPLLKSLADQFETALDFYVKDDKGAVEYFSIVDVDELEE